LDVDEKKEESVEEKTEESVEDKTEEPKVTPNLNKKIITYRRRDGGNNTRIDRF